MKSIGILGFGKLGQFLYENLKTQSSFQISFVWNRSEEKLKDIVSETLILKKIEDLPNYKCDLVVEVCHPDIIKLYGHFILCHCDLMIGSPTSLADKCLRESLLSAAVNHSIYIPSGAMWGLEDIRKLDESKKLKKLKITMEKHPDSFKLLGEYKSRNESAKLESKHVVIYEGPVKNLCNFAPNNVNTMAAAALASRNFGFENVIGCLISDPNNTGSHIVTVEVESVTGLQVTTKRINPAVVGEVTGSATFTAFLSNVKRATGANSGLNFC